MPSGKIEHKIERLASDKLGSGNSVIPSPTRNTYRKCDHSVLQKINHGEAPGTL
jgi:hypothetical protein